MKKNVLIVDQEESFRVSLGSALKREGFETDEAGDAFEAFQKISRSGEKGLSYDLLVVSIQMPVVNGVELLDRLEEHSLHFPTLFTTYFMDEDLFAGLLRRQCRDYIEKPATPEEAVARIKAILQNGEAEALPSTAVFRRKGGDAMIIEWRRPEREKKKGRGRAR
jgi:DNA-binding response OmpR family regulator